MQYRFETRTSDRSDLASGSVFRSAPGYPAFPVRLANELFHRAYAFWAPSDARKPCDLYDPCCGAGYSLAILKLLNWPVIRRVSGSDIDAEALELARSNLDLLRLAGIDARIRYLAEQVASFGKPSHLTALASAQRLRAKIGRLSTTTPLDVEIGRADALQPRELAPLIRRRGGDIIFADVPYGSATTWTSSDTNTAETTMARFLISLAAATTPHSIIIVAESKTQPRIVPSGFALLASFRGKGHRLARIFRRLDEASPDSNITGKCRFAGRRRHVETGRC